MSTAVAEPESPPGIPPLARLPVLGMAAAVGLLLLVTSAIGGYWFDELYFVAAGHHLSWGYADQPWLVPVLAGGLDTLFPGSLPALRLPVTVTAALGVVVTAQIARELGGRTRAQVMAAGAYSVSGWLVPSSHWLVTYSLDPFWWLLVSWLVVRWVRFREQGVRRDGPLLWAGIVTAAAMQTKFLIPAFWLALGAGVIISGPRDLLRRPLLWVGAAVAVLATLPTLVWQAAHGWPYLEFSRVVAAESSRLGLVLGVPQFAGLIGMVLAAYALWHLFGSADLRPYRFLAWAFVVVMALFLVLDGRAYYPAGMYGVLFAVAAAHLERQNMPRWWKWVAWPGYVLSAIIAAGTLLLIVVTTGNLTPRETAEPVAQAYHALPREQQARTVIVAEIYPSAATLDHYAAELRMPRAYSPHRGYWYFGVPPETADTVLYASVGGIDRLRPYFRDTRQIGGADSGLWLLEKRTESWSAIWQRSRFGLSAN